MRLSGPEAVALAEGVFSEPLGGLAGFVSLAGTVAVQAPCPIAAPGRAYLFRAPRSYTRQDVVELHVPGEVVASVVCAAVIAAGARQADPGEFTARAFLSGRLDLASAEAVADVVDAEADAQLRSAIGVLDGALSRLCRPAAETLTKVLAEIEAGIDFADEDLALATPPELAAAAGEVAENLTAVLSRSGRWVRPQGTGRPRAAIAGRPNVGKSSLLNALSGVDRAIVSAMAGTTRDVLSAPAVLPGGVQVTLLDAAGLEDLADSPGDPLACAVHSAAREATRSAEAVLFVIDAAADAGDADRRLLGEVVELNRRAPLLILANKIDLLDEADERVAALRRRFGRDVLAVSALTGEGLDDLRRVLAERLGSLSAPQPDGLLLHDRQRRGIAAAAEAAGRAAEILAAADEVADAAELVAVELRAALGSLGRLTGEVVTEDILSAIFSRFCVGK